MYVIWVLRVECVGYVRHVMCVLGVACTWIYRVYRVYNVMYATCANDVHVMGALRATYGRYVLHMPFVFGCVACT